MVDGADDFLAPHGGSLDAGFVDPDGDTSLPKPGDEILNPLPIGRAVTDENFLCHVNRCGAKAMNLLQKGQPWNMRGGCFLTQRALGQALGLHKGEGTFLSPVLDVRFFTGTGTFPLPSGAWSGLVWAKRLYGVVGLA